MWKSLTKKMKRVRKRKWSKMTFLEEKVGEAKVNY
jgi:hypothetical protein